MRVLLVEDNDGDADLVAEALSGALSDDIQLARVDRLNAASRRLADERFDLVLLDLSLPDATGLEGLRGILATAPSTPVVVLTGLLDTAAGTRAIEQGAQDYLQKGEVNGSELLRAIRYA
ncbi:MAG: response regulator, partial [Myxococcales bacterium]